MSIKQVHDDHRFYFLSHPLDVIPTSVSCMWVCAQIAILIFVLMRGKTGEAFTWIFSYTCVRIFYIKLVYVQWAVLGLHLTPTPRAFCSSVYGALKKSKHTRAYSVASQRIDNFIIFLIAKFNTIFIVLYDLFYYVIHTAPLRYFTSRIGILTVVFSTWTLKKTKLDRLMLKF